MAKLYRNATTNEYYTETAMDGEFVTLSIHPDGGEFLEQEGVAEGSRIPAEVFAVLEENEWLSALVEKSVLFAADDGVVAEQPSSFEAVSTEDAQQLRATGKQVPPPEVRVNPRPWMEQENVDRMRAEADAAAAGTGQAPRRFSATAADKANANPLTHAEDAAFVGGVWFWLLVVAAVAIIAWGLFEVL